MKNFKCLLAIYSATLIFGCTDTAEVSFNGTPVVSGFLYNTQPVDSLRVSLSLPYNGDGVLQVLDDLEIVIIGGGTTISLSSIGGGYYSSEGISIKGDQEYDLSFNWNNQLISANTYIPEQRPVEISESVIERTKIEASSSPIGGFGGLDFENIEVKWSNMEGEYYFVQVEHIDTIIELINDRFADRPARFFRSEPIVTDSHLINGLRDIQYFGRHRVIVYRLNPEYAALYESVGSSSLSIEAPPTNIDNGLGIFTGISTDTVYFDVVKK